MRLTPIERLLVKTEQKTNGCLIYTGQLDKNGYGRVGSGVSSKYIRAHRLSYIHFHGPIPNGLMVCHTCDTPACINPNHLFLGTAKDNSQDREAKGRGTDVSGIKNPMSRLTEEQVRQIHKLFNLGETLVAISKKFNVTFSNISQIVKGNSWKNIYFEFHGTIPEKLPTKPRLSDASVLEIHASRETCAVISKKFNISTAQVSRIRNGKRSGSSLISPNISGLYSPGQT